MNSMSVTNELACASSAKARHGLHVRFFWNFQTKKMTQDVPFTYWTFLRPVKYVIYL